MKVLNLYAGIGGNRKLWTDVEVTAIEWNPQIAQIYRDLFPDDEVIETDAHQYLLENYEGWDFIWSSPPCPSHSKIRNVAGVGRGQNKPIYPDMKLYEEIIFLNQVYHSSGCAFDGKWCVENVISYYDPLIKPYKRARHYFWSNFYISEYNKARVEVIGDRGRESVKQLQKYHGVNLEDYKIDIKDKVKILRNCVNPHLGEHIFDCAFNTIQQKILVVDEL